LHAARELRAGEVLRAEDMQVVRPNDGLHPRHFDAVIGLKLTHDLPAGSALTWNAFKA
jgi:sialic acid synthase SpsE